MKNKTTIMKKALLLSVISIALNSCMSIAWIGYDKPEDSDYMSIENVPIKIGMQNLKNENQRKAIEEATKEVFSILKSEEFRKKVESKDWLISCKIENGNKDILDGKSVFKILNKGYVNLSINPRKPWRAIAQAQKSQTDHTKNRIAIKPKRINTWFSNNIETKSELVNTIAHELTHTVSFKFLDTGHGTVECPDAELVSYGIGNLVAKMWIEKQLYTTTYITHS
ncbi:hypothetical protein CXF54_12290 [Olleya sp. 1-3]|nr:hypothetical protein CXF54_12290 [Olleya sp. 1-3]